MISSARHSVTRHRGAGFTLIEAMIVLVVLAILAAIVYPGYAKYVHQAKRAAAKTALMDVAAAQERHFFSTRDYTTNLTAAAPTGLAYPGIYVNANGMLQSSSSDAVYSISAVTSGCGGAPCFKLEAAPQGSQSGDSCGTFSLDSRRVKGPTTSGCW